MLLLHFNFQSSQADGGERANTRVVLVQSLRALEQMPRFAQVRTEIQNCKFFFILLLDFMPFQLFVTYDDDDNKNDYEDELYKYSYIEFIQIKETLIVCVILRGSLENDKTKRRRGRIEKKRKHKNKYTVLLRRRSNSSNKHKVILQIFIISNTKRTRSRREVKKHRDYCFKKRRRRRRRYSEKRAKFSYYYNQELANSIQKKSN